MSVVIKHNKVCGGENDPSKEISKDAWNDGHVIEGLGSAAEASTSDFDPAGTAAAALLEAFAADFSGDYDDLTNKPSLFSGSYTDLSDKPSLFSGAYDDLTGAPSLFSGSYDDLSDKPSLGDAAAKNVGTSSGTVAAGDHTHAGGGSALDAWPVGSVFIAVVATSPATLLGGGTWSAFGAGRMLIGRDSGDADFDTAEETGGAKAVTLTAAQSGLPAHRHQTLRERSATTGGATTLIARTSDTSSTADTNVFTENVAAANAAEAHTNMPPYIVTYMWKRTA